MNSAIVLLNAKKLAAAGNYQEAERMLRGMLTREPRLAEGWLALGKLLFGLRRHSHAAEALTQSLRVRPDQAEAYLELARAYGGLSQWQPALEAAWTATRLAPQNADAWLELAKRARLAMRPRQALSYIQRAYYIRPKHVETMMMLCLALREAGSASKAIEYGRSAVELDRNPQTLVALASCLHGTGKSEEALSLFEEARRLAPDLADPISGVAISAEAVGDKARAIETIEQAIDRGLLNNPMIGQLSRLVASDDRKRLWAISLVRRQLEITHTNPASMITLWFGLGALLEADQDYAGAFDAYMRANSLYGSNYRPQEAHQNMTARIEAFSREVMARLPRSDRIDERPVFIIGMPRSGTTLLEQIIGNHPRAVGVGELDDIGRIVRTLPNRVRSSGAIADTLSKLTPDVLNEFADEYLERISELAPGKDRVVDKMPGNYYALGLITLMLPRAKLIHSRRNPIDTCLSCFTTGLQWTHAYSTSLASLVIAYKEYHRLMEHWKTLFGDRLLDMNYENLVAEPETESRRLIAGVDLEWDPACLKFYEGKRAVTTASVSQVRRPIYSSSIGRWKRFEPFIGELIEGLKDYL